MNRLVGHFVIPGVRTVSNCHMERCICTLDRTHNRSMSPRLAVSGPQKNVCGEEERGVGVGGWRWELVCVSRRGTDIMTIL